MGKFKHGLFLGGIVGAALTWMNTTKRGREVRKELVEHAATVYADVKEQVMTSEKFEDLSQHEYVQKVQEAVDKYAIENGLADDVKAIITKVVEKQWGKMKGSTPQKKAPRKRRTKKA